MGHTGKLSFDDQFRLHPNYILAPLVRRQFDRPSLNSQRIEALEKIARHFLCVAGTDAPSIAKLTILMNGNSERANRFR